MIRVGVLEERLHRRQRRRASRLQPLEPAGPDVDGRTSQRLDLTRGRTEIDRRVGERPALRRDAVNPAVALVVAHLMSADDRVVPIGNIDGAVGARGHVARTKPLSPILVDPVPDVVLIRRGEAREEVEPLEDESRTLRLRSIAEDHVPAGVRAQEQAAVARSERVTFVQRDAGWRTGSRVVARRQHAGIVLMPVRRERALSRPSIGLPEARAVRAEVPRVRAFHQPRRAAGHHLIVVVVLPEVAERIDGQLVRVAEVVREHREGRAVGLDSQREAARVHASIVAHHAAGVLQVVGRAAGVEAARTQRPLRSIGHRVRSGVAGIEIPPAVRSRDDGVQAVIVIEAAEAGQQDLLAIGLVVAVVVRVDDEVGRCRHDDPIADHREAERRAQVRILDEHRRAIGFAVPVGVLEDEDAIPGGMRERLLFAGIEVPIVDRFRHPHAPARVDVDVRRVEEHRRLGPQRDLQIVGQHELVALRPHQRTNGQQGQQRQPGEPMSHSETFFHRTRGFRLPQEAP